MTILTILGHSVNPFRRLVDELRPIVEDWVVVHNPEIKVTDFPVIAVKDDLPNHWDASHLRNLGLEKVKSKWVLHLDSDEWLSRWQLKKLEAVIAVNEDIDCWKLPRRNVRPDDDWVGWPDDRPVLHRADTGIRWRNRVEEWPGDVKKMMALPFTSDYTILHLQTEYMARVMAMDRRNDAKAAS